MTRGTGVCHCEGLFLVVSHLAVLRPTKVHFLIVLFDELGYPGYFAVAEDTSVLEYCVTIALDEELGGAALAEPAVAGMDVHAFYHTEGREIEVITHHLEIIILRHGSVLHIFQVLL